MAANEFIWGQIAITLSLVATGLFVALFIASRLTDRPILIVIGSFVLTATLAFFGGSTGAAISSV